MSIVINSNKVVVNNNRFNSKDIDVEHGQPLESRTWNPRWRQVRRLSLGTDRTSAQLRAWRQLRGGRYYQEQNRRVEITGGSEITGEFVPQAPVGCCPDWGGSEQGVPRVPSQLGAKTPGKGGGEQPNFASIGGETPEGIGGEQTNTWAEDPS